MDNYIKTIINGLKAWVTSGMTRLEASVSKLSGNLDTLGSKITSLTSKVTKAQTTANNAQSAANNAQSAANNAQSAANNAQSAAATAQTTANNAQSAAATAQATANNAQTTANNVKSAANVKWQTGMLGCIYDAGKNGNVMTSEIAATAPVEGSEVIYLLVVSFRGGVATSLTGITGVEIETKYANFEESVTIDQFDLLKVTMTAGANSWQAEKTGINLGANALATALSEVYEE